MKEARKNSTCQYRSWQKQQQQRDILQKGQNCSPKDQEGHIAEGPSYRRTSVPCRRRAKKRSPHRGAAAGSWDSWRPWGSPLRRNLSRLREGSMPSAPSGPCSSSDRLSKGPHVWNCQELLSELDHVPSTMPMIEAESECLLAGITGLLLFSKEDSCLGVDKFH